MNHETYLNHTKVRSIEKEFVVLSPTKNATVEACDASLYERLATQYQDFAGHELVSCYEFDDDWGTWEIHPNGDEVVVLLCGDLTFIVQEGDTHSKIRLSASGSYTIIPRDTWHTAKIHEQSKVLFITPGQGTQNKPI